MKTTLKRFYINDMDPKIVDPIFPQCETFCTLPSRQKAIDKQKSAAQKKKKKQGQSSASGLAFSISSSLSLPVNSSSKDLQ
jgi:hypothetical protein